MEVICKKTPEKIFEYSSQHVYKADTKATCTEIEWNLFLKKLFEQQCAILHALLNHGDLPGHCSFIGLNDTDTNSQCLSNAEPLSYETVSPKNHVK